MSQVLNKIDLPGAEPVRVSQEIEEVGEQKGITLPKKKKKGITLPIKKKGLRSLDGYFGFT